MKRASRPSKTRRLRALALLFGGVALWAAACTRADPPTGGETHFLKSCTASSSCGDDLSCVCGVCTRACTTAAECAGLPAAECIASGDVSAQCASPMGSHCDVPCNVNGDCAVVSPDHTCVAGFCRGDGGEGGQAGAGACTSGQVAGDEVLFLGDRFMSTGEIRTSLEALAREAGALGAGESYRDNTDPDINWLALDGNAILEQYTTAAAQAPVRVVVMDGGGTDILSSTCEPLDSTCPTIENAVAGAVALFERLAEDGVLHAVYAFYPDIADAQLRAGTDALRPFIQQACSDSPVPCHFLDLRPVFADNAEFRSGGGLSPTPEGARATAEAIWSLMRERCIAQ
jgi:hypothetical protein